MPSINKQPLFAGTIRMVTTTFDPPVITDNFRTIGGNWNTLPQLVYQGVGYYGDIVDRITISSTGDLDNINVTAKLVYVYLGDYNINTENYTYSLYKTLAMPATTLGDATPNPELELVFQGGLLLKAGDTILIGASTNNNNTGEKADSLSVTVEGGTYNQQ